MSSSRRARRRRGSRGRRWHAQGRSLPRRDIVDHRSLRRGWQDVAARVCPSAAPFCCRRSASRPTPPPPPRRRRRTKLTVTSLRCLMLTDSPDRHWWQTLTDVRTDTGSAHTHFLASRWMLDVLKRILLLAPEISLSPALSSGTRYIQICESCHCLRRRLPDTWKLACFVARVSASEVYLFCAI